MDDRHDSPGGRIDPRLARRVASPARFAAYGQWVGVGAILTVLACASGGCGKDFHDTHLDSPYPQTRVVAIAPFINQSGSREVQPWNVTDSFFSELQKVRGLQALPLNRSLQTMEALRMTSVTSPSDAIRLAKAMGVDLIFVGAITAYDAYDPPEFGLTLQLYAVPGRGVDEPGPFNPRAQVPEVYRARDEIVQKQIREYAEIRGGKDTPLGWRLYMKSMPDFVRFCCFRAIRQIMQLEQDRIWLDGNVRPASNRK